MFTKVLRSFGMRGRVLTLDAPISGDVIPLSEVNDQTFATGLLGQGVAIQPTGTRVIAPADAKVEAIFPTGHAVALNTVDGLDVLIHVGLDTVQLEGKHFTVHAQVGDVVHKGDVLIEFDREAIAAEGVPTYAKLSLEELSGLPEYATIKEVVSDKLRAASVEHHIIPGGGRDWLLFKVQDAPEVDEAFRQLEQETGKAADRARERLSEIAERRQAPERLAERAERAREASRAHSQGLGRDRGPRNIEGPER